MKTIIIVIFLCVNALYSFANIENPSRCAHCDIVTTAKIKLIGDYIYSNFPPGIRRHNLNDTFEPDMSKWEIYAFEDSNIADFVLFDDGILAAMQNYYDEGDLFITKSFDNQTITKYTPLIISEYKGDCNLRIKKLVQSPSAENIIYALADEAVFKSIDCGESWELMFDGHEYLSFYISSFKISPFDENLIIMGADNGYWEGDFRYSTDGAVSWNGPYFIFPLSGYGIFAPGIAYHPTDENIAVVAGGKVARTSDKCQTWENAYIEPTGDSYGGIFIINFDTRNNNRLYGSAKGAILNYSDDLGATWQEFYPIDFGDESSIVDFVQHGSKMYLLSSSYKLVELDLDKVDLSVNEIVPQQGISMTVASDLLSFRSEENVMRVEIISADGNKMQSQELNSQSGSIEISSLPAGTYIAVFATASGNKTRKFNR